jgi:catechol 2,3-dioxygenase-like lactoylglutathione lyase family enzyme
LEERSPRGPLQRSHATRSWLWPDSSSLTWDFQVKGAQGRLLGLNLKVNDDQFLEFLPNGGEEGGFHLERVSLLTPDIEKAHQMLRERQCDPRGIRTGPDGNPRFDLADFDGTTVDFVQYVPGSLQGEARGKAIGKGRISVHLQHAGLAVEGQDASMAFFRDRLGFWETSRGGPAPDEIRWINLMMPGGQGDYLELMVHAAHPPARRQHVCLAVPDIHLAHKRLLERGLPPRFKPFLAQTGQWLMNIRDPNGIRVEFMEVK